MEIEPAVWLPWKDIDKIHTNSQGIFDMAPDWLAKHRASFENSC